MNHQSKLWPAISAYLGIFLFGIVIVTLGSLLPHLTEKYDLSEAQGGALASMLAFGILIGSIIFGPTVDRYSFKIPLIIATLSISAGMELLVLEHAWHLTQFSFIAIGFGGGMMNGITSALINELTGTDQKKRSANFSILGVFFGLGALGTPAVLRILLRYFTYEQIFEGIGWIIFIPVFLFLVTSFPEVKNKLSFSFRRWGSMFKDSFLILFGMVAFFQGSLESLPNNWITTFLPNHAGFDMQTSLIILSLFMASYTLGRLILGWLFNKVSSTIIIIISMILIVSGYFIVAVFTSYPVLLVGFILTGLGLAAGFPMILGYIGARFTTASGTAFSIILTCALTGNILTNYAMGQLAQRYSIEIFPWFQLILAAFMGVLLYFSFEQQTNNTR